MNYEGGSESSPTKGSANKAKVENKTAKSKETEVDSKKSVSKEELENIVMK